MATFSWDKLIPFLGQLPSVVVGGAIAFATVWITENQRTRRERLKDLWQKESDRFFALEELAGKIVELLGSHLALEYIEKEASTPLVELNLCSGKFRRHRNVLQAIRDFHNRAGIVLDTKRHHEDSREAVQDLEVAYDSLLKACDEVLKR